MKKVVLFMAIAAFGLAGCEKRPQPLIINNELTAEQIEAGVFTPDVLWKMGRVGEGTLSPDANNLLYTRTDYSVEENRGVTTICVQNLATKEVATLTDTSSNNVSPQWSADGSAIYFLSDRSGTMQIWRMNTQGDDLKQLSTLDKDVEGFGVSPVEDKVFYVLRTQVCDRKSSDVHKDMAKSDARIYDDLMCRHWDYWDEGSYLHIYIADLDGTVKNGIDIIGADAEWDAPLAPYFDMAEITWNSEGTQVAYTCKKLTGKMYAVSTDSDIFVYNLADSATRNICKLLNGRLNFNIMAHRLPAMSGYDKYPVFSPDDKKIAFRSMRRPGNESDKERLLIWNSETSRMVDVTADFDYNASNVVWGVDGKVYFISPIEATHQICRVPSEGGEVEVLTKGDHDINAFSLVGQTIVAQMCTISMAPEFVTVDIESGEITPLSAVNKSIYDNIRMGEVQKRWITTTDNKQMLTWVILPPDFDPNKKYPTLLYCEGGPQSVVSNGWSYRWNFQLMAAQGYVVVAPNRRGLPSFGQEWLDQISGDYSGQNIKDYLSAIDDVAKEPWVDKENLGCVGASYGGYSVYFLAGCHEGRFKAFISHCGIFDFDSMYGETEELFFVNNDYGGSYWDKSNATAMRSYANSPHKFVDKWDTPILIVTGERDFRIPYTQSLEAFTAARMRGVDARLVEFESEAHQVFKPQNSIVWNREFFGWLDKYLK